MKKVVIGLVIAILVVASVVGILYYNGSKKNKAQESAENLELEQYYGNRGNISQVEKIKFLSKNDEYLIGMIGLPVSNELKNFSNEEMIKFSLNIAIERYSTILTQKKDKQGNESYLVSKDMVNSIIEEYFGVLSGTINETESSYYSKANKAFLYGENISKTLYYYPVDMSKNEESGNVEITADAIFITDDQDTSVIESAKYEGKYQKENVDNTIKFVFNKEGKLVSYQYM